MQLELINVDDSRWQAMLSRVPHDVYHLPKYASLESRNGAGEAAALYAVDDVANEFLIPLLMRPLPRRLNLPDSWRDAVVPYGYAAPIASTDSNEAMNNFLSSAARFARDNDVIALFLRWHPLWPVIARSCIQGEKS